MKVIAQAKGQMLASLCVSAVFFSLGLTMLAERDALAVILGIGLVLFSISVALGTLLSGIYTTRKGVYYRGFTDLKPRRLSHEGRLMIETDTVVPKLFEHRVIYQSEDGAHELPAVRMHGTGNVAPPRLLRRVQIVNDLLHTEREPNP